MSDAFSDRQKGYEAKFQLDQEQQFRVNARRDKLFGLWAAAQLGKVGADADAYARDVVGSNFERPGDDDMISKVAKDLGGRVADADLKLKLREVYTQAAQQILAEKK